MSFSLLISGFVSSQSSTDFTLSDSLQDASYEVIRALHDNSSKDSLKQLSYATYYLAKAKKEKDKRNMAVGYELLGNIFKSDHEKRFAFYDKGIAISKDLNDKRYPAILYTYKGALSYLKGNYKVALENHMKAYDYAEKNDNRELVYVNTYNVGVLKKRLELYEEALTIFRKCYQYELHDPERDPEDFMRSHLALADVFTEMKQIDSATKYNRAGIAIAKRYKNNDVYDFFVLNSGINFFHKKAYQTAIDTLEKTMNIIGEYPDKLPVINGYFHLGKSYDSIQNKEKAIFYYKKVDSIFSMNPNHISSVVMENYEALYTYYRAQNDTSKEAFYIEKALFASSQSKSDYRSLSSKITKKFDRRELLSKQHELNEELKKKDKKYHTVVIVALLLSGIFMLLLIGFYFKQKRLRKHFQEFVKNHEKSTIKTKVIDSDFIEDIGVPKEVIDSVLDKLHTFENTFTFIEPDISLTNLAKRFQTNSAYLSKVVNTFKSKKFAEYLNDLRIDYAIDKIQNDKHFSLYTIKAIALEVGFNNSQSFARAFKRKTKMQPSDFIKQTKNINN
ncbi:helix-turn-helix domain-containing protein [Kordia sp.]|uniref:helix-turn-helix domain-containing protein n=1 Tax=Kordia sp. TaxID=1965332 RepID=UPI003D2D1356